MEYEGNVHKKMKLLQLCRCVIDEYLSTKKNRESKRKTRESKGSALKTEINFKLNKYTILKTEIQ